AFTVASQIDSRTILDAGGAEALLGRGDMLYSGAGSPDIIRVHGAFMEDDEVSRIADNWRARGKPQYLDSIVESLEEVDTTNRGALGDLDPLFDEVVEFVIESGITSISGIQRRFSLGFNRAGRIIDQLEAQGIISEPGKGGKREVLSR
ncbi:DNA translocase FtsK, partial [uncultured Actinobacillus sp.]|uniref:DNA translocase FtsK n=1 Tax=uncultured Actinobacillus sp. TaxID=417616 RepID=UPI0025D97D29